MAIYRAVTLLRLWGMMKMIDAAVMARNDSSTEGIIAAELYAERFGFTDEVGLEALEMCPNWVALGYAGYTEGWISE
jgi:hypothetical protein